MDHFECCFMSKQVTFVREVRCVWVEITVHEYHLMGAVRLKKQLTEHFVLFGLSQSCGKV